MEDIQRAMVQEVTKGPLEELFGCREPNELKKKASKPSAHLLGSNLLNCELSSYQFFPLHGPLDWSVYIFTI